MKILYISPENTVGTLTLWREEHIIRGNECRTITFFRSPKNFSEDICLDLPFNFTKKQMAYARNLIYKYYRGGPGYYKPKKGYPPKWEPEGIMDSLFLTLKDMLWSPVVKRTIEKYNLYDFDVIHFESGIDFLKNEFFVKELKNRGKKIIAHYHGEDLRTRGVMPIIDSISDLNLTNEVDLLNKHPNIKYLFLPFDTTQFTLNNDLRKNMRIAHAPTNRYYKGSDFIIKVCRELHASGQIQFDLIENLPHEEALKRKQKADIFIDQIGDKGGWGYGMNSVESLSMGICTLTQINDTYQKFIPDNPFVNVNKQTLKAKIIDLINNREKVKKYASLSKEWVFMNHDIKNVGDKLYSYYKNIGLDT